MTNLLQKLFVAAILAALAHLCLPVAMAETTTADAVYQAAGVQGGFVVHLGCGDGQLTSSLLVNGRYLVQGLDRDPAKIESARDLVRSKGQYGKVTIEQLRGDRLPYTDKLANLVVVSGDGCQVSEEEIQRVLCPGGVMISLQSSAPSLQIFTKPWPEDVDQWTHFLHDASGNAVAHDQQVGSPKRLRWVAEPRWCRSHEIPSSVNAIAAADGRIFTIFDEGPTGVYRGLPQKCNLVARDAANGVFLWKVPMQQWQPEFGTGEGNRWNIHHTIPRRLIAEGDRVYVTLQFLDSPVSVLDAATGRMLVDALPGTQGTDEMLLSDGVLLLKKTQGRSIGATERIGKEALNDALAAVDVDTGELLWQIERTRVLPYVFCALDGKLVYHDMDELICLDVKTGEPVWRMANPIQSTLGAVITLVLDDGVVLFNGPTDTVDKKTATKKKSGQYLTAYSLDDGQTLWQQPGKKGQAGACTQPADLFVVDGLVWCGGSVNGYDLHTGEVKQTLTLDQLISPGHHYRCHRSKATDRFLIWPKRGAEFVDLEEGEHMRNDWLRAPCFTGATPANGLLYVPPSQCFCYPGVKVSGYLAMSAEPADVVEPASDSNLERGPAYGTAALPPLAASLPSNSDWPMYRRDFQRSGATKTALSAKLSECWTKELTCRASQAVIVGDRVWLAEKDSQGIRCLDAKDGADVWSFTAGGRIDSAPTIYNGLVLFGCCDGSVYCLRATDGALAWRFQAAPEDKRLVSYGQVESVWPVQGSVLVQDGMVYFAAGRSSFLDGGMVVYALDAETGSVRYHHVLEGPWPDVTEEVGTPFAMEGALPDLFVSDGQDLYMQRIKFDAQLNRLETTQESPLGELDMGANHLVPTGGFLDDTGFDRVYWMYSQRWPGFYFAQQSPKAGQLVVFDDSTTYAVKYFYRRIQWSPAHFPGDQGFLLFADDNNNQPALGEKGQPDQALNWLPKEAATDSHRRGGRGVEKGTGYIRVAPEKWQTLIPLRIRAMLLADDLLFAAGPPDAIDPADPLATFEDRGGAKLNVYSTADGSLVQSYDIPSAPAFDGLSTAGGRLYLATQDGRVMCWDATVSPKK